MERDLISIIIPVYNSESFLEECLNSVVSQTYQNIEIITIDDGSTDASSQILKKYSDKITVISQKNHGLASALNSGISKMNGSWFKWFSPDDVMYPDTIEILMNEVKKHSDNTIIYSNWNIIDDKGNFLREFHESNYNELDNFDFGIRLLDAQQINVNTALIPSHLLKNISFRNTIDPVMLDYYFFLYSTFFSKTKFYLISKPLIKYRIHSKQLSHQNILKSINSSKEIKNTIIMDLSSEVQNHIFDSLRYYQKNKSIKNKILENCLKLLQFFPNKFSNKIVLFYLNKIRSER